MKIWKVCPTCKCNKPTPAFCIARATKDGRYFECKACAKIRSYCKPKVKRKTAYRCIRTPEKDAYKKAWRDANRERVRASNAKSAARDPDKTRRQKSEYAKRNPGIVNAKTYAYRAKKKSAIPPWADVVKIRAIYIECESTTLLIGVEHNVDHIVPLQSKIVCGLHCEANLQILPKIENAKKGNRHWPDMP